jgi:hypothetical protein
MESDVEEMMKRLHIIHFFFHTFEALVKFGQSNR